MYMKIIIVYLSACRYYVVILRTKLKMDENMFYSCLFHCIESNFEL